MSKTKTGLVAALVLSVSAVFIAVTSLLFATGVLDAGFEAKARAYLLRNPEVLVEALQRLDKSQKVAEANELQTLIAKRHDEIFNDPASPVSGNPEGDVTLVEFFDYNCPYCRKAAPVIQEAVKADPGLRFVHKEWPILGPGSEFAAKAALASQRQGKYEAFHRGLMGFAGAINETSTLTVAGQVGLDVERLKQDMLDPAISPVIERNRALATELRITGTPTFVVGDEIIRGLVDLETLQQSIAGAREKPEG